MAKFCGNIGYATQIETAPGVWRDTIVERKHQGDILDNVGRWASSTDSTNDNLSLGNKFSIMINPYAMKNCHSMRYIVFMGVKWKITSVDYKHPRLIISTGGVYNDGEQA